MKLYIPTVGDELVLTSDWNFNLFNEDRNSTLMEFIGDTRTLKYFLHDMTSIPCTIPAGETLKVDRIYIRKGKGYYNSITLLWKGKTTAPRIERREARGYNPDGTYESHFYESKIPRKPVRFWVKLEDANKIEFEVHN